MSTNSELRTYARNALRGNWGMAVLVAFLFTAISTAAGSIPGLNLIAPLILTGPLTLGLYAYFLQLARGTQPDIGIMFTGFQKFGAALLLNLLQLIFIFLWSLLLVIPGIIAYFRYSMAYFILHDYPEISAMEALRRSKELMVGRKGKLFLLYLSFIGWAFLCALTFGIGLLWLLPYVQTSLAAFYEQIKMQSI